MFLIWMGKDLLNLVLLCLLPVINPTNYFKRIHIQLQVQIQRCQTFQPPEDYLLVDEEEHSAFLHQQTTTQFLIHQELRTMMDFSWKEEEKTTISHLLLHLHLLQ